MKTISKKILIISFALIMLITVILLIISYQVFFQILSKNLIQKKEQTLTRQVMHFDAVISEINTLSNSIVLDSQVQSFCKDVDLRNKYTFQMQTNKTLTNSLRLTNIVDNMVICTEDRLLWTLYTTDQFYKTQMNKQWYTELKEKPTFFSSPYVADTKALKNASYITNRSIIFDLSQPFITIGELLININYNDLKDEIEVWGDEYDGYIVFDTEKILFAYNNTDWYQDFLKEFQVNPYQSKGTLNTDKSYIFWTKCEFSDIFFVGQIYKSNISKDLSNLVILFIALIPVLSLLLLSVLYPILFNITSPISKITKEILSYEPGKEVFLDIHTDDELEVLSNSFKGMVKVINSDIVQKIQKEQEKQKIELDLLMSKIHPHFMYNTLNSLIYVARKNNNLDLVNMTQSLIYIYQDTMVIHTNQIEDTIENEISYNSRD